MNERISRLPRWMHRLYANALGYFWLPCPLCGRESGGHEWLTDDPRAFIPDPDGRPNTRRGICPACTRVRAMLPGGNR